MVGKLFNDLVTTLDILLDTPTIDICTNHSSVCSLRGKIRIIAKRPFVFRSLLLSVNGASRIALRQSAKTFKYKQVFLDVTKDLALEHEQSASLHEGMNEIDFVIDFPSHLSIKNNDSPLPPQPLTIDEAEMCPLPSGPTKTQSTDSSISYKLSAMLVMSRRDILVNNHVSAWVPFRVQAWQDAIDFRLNEDHSYHGKRRARIEFQFQVPKQLDSQQLGLLQFGFQGSWRTLHDHLKVKEIQYFLIEEELQKFTGKISQPSTTIISTTASYDCSITSAATPTHTWNHFQNPARLQIPQPLKVLETTRLPFPHAITISHKLRVLIKFDPTLSKERDLQLSFPVNIHPVLSDDGAPVHPDPTYHYPAQQRSRRRHALYGIIPRGSDYGDRDGLGEGEDDNDDDLLPLPMYADRETTLLLMVGQEIQETGNSFSQTTTPASSSSESEEVVEALGISMPGNNDRFSILSDHNPNNSLNHSSNNDNGSADEQNMLLQSPLGGPLTSFLASPPVSPTSSILSRTHFFDQTWTGTHESVLQQESIPQSEPPPYGFQSSYLQSPPQEYSSLVASL
ncbi:hypothetical protein BGZ83_008286 [Gryganskiella cystojenkinii]|nr:hypothetical protein BGZ83_008286 [Gryganskiella cystojenkinii]